jgi:hypothetical protein
MVDTQDYFQKSLLDLRKIKPELVDDYLECIDEYENGKCDIEVLNDCLLLSDELLSP